MYIPKANLNDDPIETQDLIRKYPLATLITCHAQGPFISHLPLVLEIEEDRMVLYGHLARANPHADLLPRSKITAVFMGPHGYITPTWYAKEDVPTWNYMTVHAHGTVEMMEEDAGIVLCLKKLTDLMESNRSPAWKLSIPEDLQENPLSKHILGFKIQIEKIEAKFKLSQNRSDADFHGVLAGLSRQQDDLSRTLAQHMKNARR